MLSSCSVTRYVPKGEYLLTKNSVEIKRQKDIKHGDSFIENELTKYIKQKPNKRFLGTNFYLGMYNLSDTSKNNWFNRTLRKIGEEPVVYDSALTAKSAQDINTFMEQSGFFASKTEFTTTTKKHKIQVKYHVTEGLPYHLGKITYSFRDKVLEPIILKDTMESLLKPGNIFNTALLEAERQRITAMLQDMGYYFFNVNNINYIADSTVGKRTVDIRMVVRQQPMGYDENGDQILDNNKIYRIHNIYINPNYDPTVALVDSAYNKTLDTMEFKGFNFVYPKKLNVRPDVLVRALNIFPGDLYNANSIQLAHKNMARLNFFKTTNFSFTEVQDSTSEKSIVSFIDYENKDTNKDQDVAFTKEGALDFRVQSTPGLRQGYKFELEANVGNDYYGILGRVGYLNRNIFRGVELFEVNVTGGYEIMHTVGRRNSYEFGVSTSFTIPRFVTPFKVDRYNKLNSPRSIFELAVNIQNRPYYNRVLSSAAFGYSWSNKHFSTFVLKPIDINLIKINSIDQNFFDNLVNQNEYLANSYKSQLLAGLSGSVNYNNQLRDLNLSSINATLNYETSGNLLALYSTLFSKKRESDEGPRYHIFGIKYAQYVRADINFSYRYVISPKTSLVSRVFLGAGIAYGNSSSIPFERMFYAGGSNSMRGWQTRTLGPGNQPLPEGIRYPSQQGNLKFEANLEARFPVAGMLHGAVFCDLGNVFLMGKGVDPQATFKFNDFYKKLGFNTGVGARLDFGFFLFRLDWGVKLYNPNWLEGQRWIRDLTLRNTTFNFAVGYPF